MTMVAKLHMKTTTVLDMQEPAFQMQKIQNKIWSYRTDQLIRYGQNKGKVSD
jgi:hypothetical protein